ncbi:protein-glutamine gamma-glutamyltransferase K [Acipenser oxyrinchus oxyrinchus]|uniref:protein-glutamine gamma-glutamyltransferase n=1 Tax=Acipenser oxyrinchus oxyrinchus TaxID=40147 RepID=A0AAD8CLS6_ACIOX|nr:protein-glutamine gamma-glutamyltransferase K [Acipenser oxyrinchus oxyrinchus]
MSAIRCAFLLQPEGSAVVGQKMQAKIIFTNPLPKTLKSAVISVEGPGLQTPKRINIGVVARHSTITLTETFVPAKSGPRKLYFTIKTNILYVF